MIRNRQIALSTESITVTAADGRILETIPLMDVQQVYLLPEYRQPEENVQSLVDSLKGKSFQNYFIIQARNEQRRFDFVLESHYMITQLNKVTAEWKQAGENVKFIS